jgi:hypothetical protein
MTMNTRMRVALIAAPLLFTLALSGCRATGKDNGVASAGGVKKGNSAAATGDPAEQMRLFAQCMRAQGIDVPDPDPNNPQGGAMMQLGDPNAGGPDPAKVDAAMQKCRSLLPNGGQPPKMDPADLERERQFAKCMRENGLPDFPDPDAGSGNVIIGRGSGDIEDPKFKAAQEKCKKYAPQPPGGLK